MSESRASAPEPRERLFEETSDGIVTFDRDWRIASMNSAAERINGIRRDDAIGRIFWEQFPAVLGTEIERRFREAARKGEKVRFEAFYAPGDRWFQFRLRPAPGSGLWMLQRDVTARRRSEERLVRRGAELHALLESMPDAVYIGDESGITECNTLAWKMLGFDSAEDLRRRVAVLADAIDVRYADTRERVPADRTIFSRALAGETSEMNVRVRQVRTGREIVLRSAAAPIREGDRIVGAVAINTDITDRYRAEEELRLSEERFRLLVESLRDYAIFTIDFEGRMTGWNSGAERIFGWTAEEAIGKPASLVFLESDDRKGVPARELEVAALEGRSVNERWHRRRDGSRFWGSGLVLPLRGRSGAIAGFTKIMQDRTEARLNEERLQAAKESAEAASRAKDQLLATLSHELRTPLTPVLGAAAALRARADLPPELRESLDMIHRNVELEARLIDDLLDLTRIAQGRLEIVRERVGLGSILDTAVQTSLAQQDGKRLAIERRGEDRDLAVIGDAARLTQVFWNLLNNAVKFTPEGGKIVITAERRDGRAVVEIADTGIGIPPARLASIFDVFEQGSSAIRRTFGGLGLGLAISRTIVEAHGGTIEATSEGPGRGACFTVSLPGAPAEDLPVAASPASPDLAPAPSRRLHVLLVEDHRDSAIALRTLLELLGHRVAVAGTMREAEQAASSSVAISDPFDLVVSDLGLPDGSGFDLMRELSVHFGLRGLALSGFAMEEDVRRSREAGFTAHLTKPVDLKRLFEAIESVMGGS